MRSSTTAAAASTVLAALALLSSFASAQDSTNLKNPEIYVQDGNLYLLAAEALGKKIIVDGAGMQIRTNVELLIDDPGFRSTFVLNTIPRTISSLNGTLTSSIAITTATLRSEFTKMINIQATVLDKKQEQIDAQAALIEQLIKDVAALKAENKKQQEEFDAFVNNLESRCIPGVEYEKSPRTSTSARVCVAYTQCPAGSYETKAPTLTSDRVCSVHDNCLPGQYEYTSPTSSSNRICANWTVCNSTQYEAIPPSSNNDRVCKDITKCNPPSTFSLVKATSRTDSICFPTTVCKSSEYMVQEATEGSDRVCSPLSPPCTASEYEAVSPVQVGPNQRDRKCMPLTVCNFSTQYQAAEPTATSDRRCVNLRVCSDQEYEAEAPTKFTNRNCTLISPPCTEAQFQVRAPTKSSDRVCQNLRPPCAEGEIETKPTLTSDRICRPPLPDQCFNFATIDASVFPNRFPNNTDQSSVFCDTLGDVVTYSKQWVRFRGSTLNKIPDVAPAMQRCGTHAPGWVKDGHPSEKGGVVTRIVCYHWSGNVCNWQNNIDITNCDTFFVYKLLSPPVCSLRYCVE